MELLGSWGLCDTYTGSLLPPARGQVVLGITWYGSQLSFLGTTRGLISAAIISCLLH